MAGERIAEWEPTRSVRVVASIVLFERTGSDNGRGLRVSRRKFRGQKKLFGRPLELRERFFPITTILPSERSAGPSPSRKPSGIGKSFPFST